MTTCPTEHQPTSIYLHLTSCPVVRQTQRFAPPCHLIVHHDFQPWPRFHHIQGDVTKEEGVARRASATTLIEPQSEAITAKKGWRAWMTFCNTSQEQGVRAAHNHSTAIGELIHSGCTFSAMPHIGLALRLEFCSSHSPKECACWCA